jgi:hypothetical protein
MLFQPQIVHSVEEESAAIWRHSSASSRKRSARFKASDMVHLPGSADDDPTLIQGCRAPLLSGSTKGTSWRSPREQIGFHGRRSRRHPRRAAVRGAWPRRQQDGLKGSGAGRPSGKVTDDALPFRAIQQLRAALRTIHGDRRRPRSDVWREARARSSRPIVPGPAGARTQRV